MGNGTNTLLLVPRKGQAIGRCLPLLRSWLTSGLPRLTRTWYGVIVFFLIFKMTSCDGNHRAAVWGQLNIPDIRTLLVLPYDKHGVRMTVQEFQILCQGTNWMQSNTERISRFLPNQNSPFQTPWSTSLKWLNFFQTSGRRMPRHKPKLPLLLVKCMMLQNSSPSTFLSKLVVVIESQLNGWGLEGFVFFFPST